MEDNTQERIVHLKSVAILNKAQFLEFIHEEIYPGTCGSDCFRQRLLRYFGKNFLRLVILTVSSKQ